MRGRVLIFTEKPICKAAERVLIEGVGWERVYLNPIYRGDIVQPWILWVDLKEHLILIPTPTIIATPCTGTDHIPDGPWEVLSLKGETKFLKDVHATAEHTLALTLALLRNIPAAVESVKRGEWERQRFVGRELHGKRVLIKGWGRIGKQVAKLFTAFGCVFTSRGDADIISIHVPLQDNTHGMVNAEFLAAMKPGSVLINTSRGAVIDEFALVRSLESGHLAGAALDVLCDEPPHSDHMLILDSASRRYNLIITPHLGGCTVESQKKTEVFLAKKLVKRMKELGLAE